MGFSRRMAMGFWSSWKVQAIILNLLPIKDLLMFSITMDIHDFFAAVLLYSDSSSNSLLSSSSTDAMSAISTSSCPYSISQALASDIIPDSEFSSSAAPTSLFSSG
jgi:hypothetical protein